MDNIDLAAFRSRRLWSLWDMLKQSAVDFVGLGQIMTGMVDDAALLGTPGFEYVPAFTKRGLEIMALHCERLGLEQSPYLIHHLLKENRDPTHEELHLLFKCVEKELGKLMFLLMPDDRKVFYEKPDLLTDRAKDAFPLAHEELQRAANAYALGLNTACVFHSMRSLEHGLRALARTPELNVTFARDIEIENWKTILQEIEAKVKAMGNTPASLTRERDLEFFAGATAQFWHFKDAWRNHVAHSRAVYEQPQALRVLNHVCEFLEHIHTRVKE